jgi:NADPH-dependent 2,4-dienoyl-CoA reductase/sulfur reductase-like enzyme
MLKYPRVSIPNILKKLDAIKKKESPFPLDNNTRHSSPKMPSPTSITSNHPSSTLNPTPLYDTIIIGAGLSGLQTAVSLHNAGLKICVLEATSHIGGKVRTVQSSERGYNDLGAAWINDSSQVDMYKLVQKYGVEVEVQRGLGDSVVQGYGDGNGEARRVEFGFVPV